MILINDGEFIAGTLWKVGYEPTGKNSVKNKGGLWLNEVGMEDTKEETTMIDLSNAKVDDKFLSNQNKIYELKLLDEKHQDYVLTSDSGCIQLVAVNGSSRERDSSFCLVSKQDPRWWLKDLPPADLFGDEVCFLRCDPAYEWNAVDARGREDDLWVLKMPKLTGDEPRQSKISIAELREWQDEYINV